MKPPADAFRIIIPMLILCFGLSSCELLFPDQNDDDSNHEEALESESAEIDFSGGTVGLSDGTYVYIPAEGVIDPLKLTVSKINPNGLFSETNSLVYDIEFTTAPLFMEIQFQLKEGLEEEDIFLVAYNASDTLGEIEGVEPGFIYDPTTGFATSYVYFDTPPDGSKSKSKLKHELLFNRFVVEWDEHVEGKVETQYLSMPYYVQPGQTCVATCMTMLTKAFTPYLDRKNEYEIKDYLKKLNIGKPDGVGPFTFLHYLHTYFHQYTGAGVTTAGYFSRRSLQSKIIDELDKAHPVVLRMDYPGTDSHAILIIGYQKITSGSQKVTYNFVYHNPDRSDHMYQVNSFDWLMSTKEWTTAYQILYPQEEVHPKCSKQTIGLPLNEDGFIKFLFSGTKFAISLDYDINSSVGYNWFDKQKNSFSTIPDSATSLSLNLPVWNADQKNDQDVKIQIRITKKDASSGAYFDETEVTLPVNKHAFVFKKIIPLKDFTQEGGNNEYTILVQVWDKYNEYLDGFLIEANIEPPKEQVITVDLVALDPDGIPIDKEGKQGVEYGFKANTSFTTDGTYHLDYRWNFGDEATAKGTSDTQYHTYPRAGTYSMTVEVWDYQKNIKLGQDMAVVRIIANDPIIFKTNSCGARVTIKYKDLRDNLFRYHDIHIGGPITWTGSSFKGRDEYNNEGGSNDGKYTSEVIITYNGSVTSDGKWLNGFEGTYKAIGHFKSDGKVAYHKEYAFSISSLEFPLDENGNSTSAITVTGANYVSKASVSDYFYRLFSPSDHDFHMFNEKFDSLDPERFTIYVVFAER